MQVIRRLCGLLKISQLVRKLQSVTGRNPVSLISFVINFNMKEPHTEGLYYQGREKTFINGGE